MLAVIRKLMNWYAARDDDFLSPIVKGMHRNNGGDHKRTRTLNDDEIKSLWKAADGSGTFGNLLKVSLLTAQRREKVATMKWDDIADGVWTIPTEKRERLNAGSLKLPQVALTSSTSYPAGNPYVFAAGKAAVRSIRSHNLKIGIG